MQVQERRLDFTPGHDKFEMSITNSSEDTEWAVGS